MVTAVNSSHTRGGDYPKVMIVLTDGEHSTGEGYGDPVVAADIARAENWTIFAIGVGLDLGVCVCVVMYFRFLRRNTLRHRYK